MRHNISISDISAVARRRKAKRPRMGLFTVFTPARNFHFDARSEAEANQWVHQLRISARIDEWESGLGSSEEEGELSEEPQTIAATTAPRKIAGSRSASASQPTPGPYGTSVGSFSSISSVGAANFPGSSISLSIPTVTEENIARPNPIRTASMAEMDQERILKNGQLYLLKSKGGVKKWKPVWAVLRVKGLAIYPNREVSPTLSFTGALPDCSTGVCSHPNNTLQHHRQRDRNRLAKQEQETTVLHANHQRRTQLAVLRPRRGRPRALAGHAEKPVDQATSS